MTLVPFHYVKKLQGYGEKYEKTDNGCFFMFCLVLSKLEQICNISIRK